MKVFLSVPMKGRKKEDIENTIELMKETVRNLYTEDEVTFVNTIVEEKPPYESGDNSPVWFLGKSIQILSTCDVLVSFDDTFLQKYEFNGCIIEKDIARKYGIKVVSLAHVNYFNDIEDVKPKYISALNDFDKIVTDLLNNPKKYITMTYGGLREVSPHFYDIIEEACKTADKNEYCVETILYYQGDEIKENE